MFLLGRFLLFLMISCLIAEVPSVLFHVNGDVSFLWGVLVGGAIMAFWVAMETGLL
jgi:hypothetical protein